MMRKIFLPTLLLLLLCASCISRPDYVLDEEMMVKLLTDVHRSEGLLELQNNSQQGSEDSYKQQIMAAVLVKNGVTRAQYDSSLVWYGKNLQSLVKVYNKVQKNQMAEIDHWSELNQQSFKEFAPSEAGERVELWSVNDYHVFDEESLAAFRIWEIKSDSNYIAGDSIIWHLHIPQVPESHFMVASLVLNYQLPDSVFQKPVSQTVVLRKDTAMNLVCVSDTARMFESIIASLSLMKDSTNVPDRIAFVDSLSMIRARR